MFLNLEDFLFYKIPFSSLSLAPSLRIILSFFVFFVRFLLRDSLLRGLFSTRETGNSCIGEILWSLLLSRFWMSVSLASFLFPTRLHLLSLLRDPRSSVARDSRSYSPLSSDLSCSLHRHLVVSNCRSLTRNLSIDLLKFVIYRSPWIQDNTRTLCDR